MTISDPVLFDTNILVYAHNQDSPFHKKCLALITAVIEGRFRGILAQQNLLEFYSIVTDKKRVTKPLTPFKALELLDNYLRLPFTIILPTDMTIQIFSLLSQKNKIKNGQAFDTYLVATMLSHKIKNILTVNVKDFEFYNEVKTYGIADIAF